MKKRKTRKEKIKLQLKRELVQIDKYIAELDGEIDLKSKEIHETKVDTRYFVDYSQVEPRLMAKWHYMTEKIIVLEKLNNLQKGRSLTA